MVSLCAHLARGGLLSRVRLLTFVLLLVVAWPGAHAASLDVVLDGWFASQKELRSWSADFIQTRALKSLTQPLTATGRVVFAMPDQFRWELGRPARTIALGRANDMFVIYPMLKRAERYSLGQETPKQWRDAMSLLQAGFPRGRQDFEERFKVLSISETNGTWLLALQPKSAFARQMMPELRIGLGMGNYGLLSTELIFTDGSLMRSDYRNAVINPELDTKEFDWQPPADFKVTQPLAK